MKKILVVLTAGVLLVGSIFAFGPATANHGYCYGVTTQSQAQAQTQVQTQLQTQQVTATRLYRNLPADATLSATQEFKGTIKEVSWDVQNGFVLKIQVGNDVYDVHAGPIFRAVSLKAGQSIEISGRLVTTSTSKYIVAEKVVIDGKEVNVDDVMPERCNRQAAQKTSQRMPNRGPRI
ncbi:hypothetical protein [Fervidobacterium sp. 2310opik-2]|uniref:hypothetical protein n=1 Tax=Fervidobacterium sp. 2310opik-2 TaxID=1755815 RepID=UPI0013DFD1E0|nr:hypothetical protein [Fervidobacterium sp. 2310opik-2]KAF2961031.1 hypothetical protein AS161_03380 [Fervidobacterium sp. 2310opik-2]